MMKISKYFSDYEVGKSSTAIRMGIDNTPPPYVMEAASLHARLVLDPMREEHGSISPQSWYRCEELERLLTWNGGFRKWCEKKSVVYGNESWPEYFSRKSHPRGQATDIEYAHMSTQELHSWLQAHTPTFDQLILECHTESDPNSGWVHVSSREKGNRMEVFTL